MGYVDQPLALRSADAGFRVIGFDVDEQKATGLNRGHSSIAHIPDENPQALAEAIRRLRDMPEAERRRMGENDRRAALAHYD